MNILRDRVILGFMGRLLLLLPLMFLLWHVLAGYLNTPIGWFTSLWLKVFAPGKIADVAVLDRLLAIETNLRMATPDGQMGYLLLEINPLLYTWNLPLLLGLTLAAGLRPRLWFRLLVALTCLYPFQAWGVAFDFLKSVALQYGPSIADQLSYGQYGRELIALGYQFGYLMLPVISTAALWIATHCWFINKLTKAPSS